MKWVSNNTFIQEEGLRRVKPSLESVYLSSSISSANFASDKSGTKLHSNIATTEALSFLLLKRSGIFNSLQGKIGLSGLQFLVNKDGLGNKIKKRVLKEE